MRIEGVVRDCDFRPTRASTADRYLRLKMAVRRLRRAPARFIVKPISAAPAWALYFVFAPQGALTAAHRFTLDRLRSLGRKLLVVCASPAAADLPAELHRAADALYWKAMSGYDFSAYAIGLKAIAQHSPHADVLVLNDSVYGPFGDIEALLKGARWDLTGFTASLEIEAHIQSYAFALRDVSKARLAQMRSVILSHLAFDDGYSNVYLLETRMARVASRSMSVGSLWCNQGQGDPTLLLPYQLLDQGFPFLKRSLIGKHRHLADSEAVIDRLAQLGHPRG